MSKPTRIFRVEIQSESNFGDGYHSFKDEGNFAARDAREAIEIAEVMLLDTTPFEDDNKKMITPKYRKIEALNVDLLAESDN